MQVLNIAGYKFIPLNELVLLQNLLLTECNNFGLKGTILLSEEGINISLAGLPEAINSFKLFLQKDNRFSDLSFRESYSDFQPFDLMKVKIKNEIITMHKPEIDASIDASSISPQDLKQWLDERREITLLDTRNAYEVKFGTFQNAKNLNIEDFGQFPETVNTIPNDRPIVMFCTGGIRCEKAARYLLKNGFADVHQLEGGILNYFREVGGAHYEGECFVFDQRVSVNTNLEVTGTRQCLQCQGPAKEGGCLVCNN